MRKFAANCNSGPARLRIRPVAAACATLLVASTAAYGQQTNLDVVTVTGIRASIESSIAIKKASDSIVEVISAEDIGKLPDVSLGESLARLPGITSTRVDGRSQSVVIRGLAPKYGATLLNGREVASSGADRSAEYDQFPSELINSALVYKTADASLIGQGLSGTVDARTILPLSVKGRQIVVNVRGEKNSNGSLTSGISGNGNRESFSYIDQFGGGTVGLALGIAQLDSPGQKVETKQWGWAEKNGLNSVMPGQRAGTGALEGFDAEVQSGLQQRDGLMAVLEFKPSKDFSSVADLFYSKFAQDKKATRLTGITSTWAGGYDPSWNGGNQYPDWGSGANPSVTNPVYTTIGGVDFLTGGKVAGVQSVVNNNSTKRDDDTLAFGWKNTLKLNKDWTGVADLSYSKAKRTEVYTEIYTTAGPGAQNPLVTNGGGAWLTHGTLNFSGLGTPGGMSFTTDQNYANPANLYLNGKAVPWSKQNTQTSDDQLKALRLSAKRDLDWSVFSNVDAGVSYSNRTKDVVFFNNDLKLNTPVLVPASALKGIADMSATGMQGGIMAIDPNAVVGLYSPSATPWNMANGSYTITEKVATLFGKLGIDTEVGRVPVRGNVGGQFINTTQTSAGFAWANGAATPVEESKTYSNFLPSLNLAASLQPDLIARFGWGKSIMRPAMSDLRAGSDSPRIETAPRVPGGKEWKMNGGGNPGLDPWKATGVDISIEKYLDKRSYIAAAAFHKQLDSVIYTQSTARDFSVYKPLFPAGTVFPLLDTNWTSLPANGKSGKISGVEFSATLDGGLLTKSMEGLGLQYSSTSLDSGLQGTDANGNPTNDAIDGLSGRLSTLTVYFERNGFSARAAQRSRAEYIEIQRSMIWGNQFLIHPEEKVLDLQLGYSFEAGAFKGLSFILQVNNATDEPSKTVVSKTINGQKVSVPELYRTYGKSYLFGATYKF